MSFLSKLYTRSKDLVSNPYKAQVPKSRGRRFAIPDIHGCNATFKALLETLELTALDQVFLIGDYVDRGSDSRGVINTIIQLQDKCEVYALRGNHEQKVLDLNASEDKRKLKKYIKSEKAVTLFNKDLTLPTKFKDFLESTAFFIQLEDAFLVHGGFDFTCFTPFLNYKEMISIREFENNYQFTNGKPIIHGHTPKQFKEIARNIEERSSIIPLDNGCVYTRSKRYGQLLCFNLDTYELIGQRNIESTKFRDYL